jgi:hypothetical protein
MTTPLADRARGRPVAATVGDAPGGPAEGRTPIRERWTAPPHDQPARAGTGFDGVARTPALVDPREHG